MENGVSKRLLGAFLVGGCIGLVCQVIYVFWRAILGSMADLAMPLMLICMCILAAILVATGVYGKIEKVGYMGATLPVSGLISGIAGLYAMGAEQGGPRVGRKMGMKLFLYVLGVGPLLAATVGIFYALLG